MSEPSAESELQNGQSSETDSKQEQPEQDEVTYDSDPITDEATPIQENGAVEMKLEPVTLTSEEEAKHQEPEATLSQSDAAPADTTPELKKDERSQTFTMRELLSGLKGDPGSGTAKPDSSPPYRYAVAIERNPGDYDAFYNWALVLQETADNVDTDFSSPSKDALLEEACKKYEEATRLCPTLHDAYYNWAIAISDRARMCGRAKEAEELWMKATKHYQKAVQLNWNSPQFRAAIQLQFDFHRAIYNLGTVLYGLAEDTLRIGGSGASKEAITNDLYSQCAIYIAAALALKPNYSEVELSWQSREANLLSHSHPFPHPLELLATPATLPPHSRKEESERGEKGGGSKVSPGGRGRGELGAGRAWALLALPLPYLKVGYLTAPPAENPIAPHGDWKWTQFVLNHECLYQLIPDEQKEMWRSLSSKPADAVIGKKAAVKVGIPDIVSVSASADLTLPPGAGLCIDTIQGPVFLVADSWESLDGWLDAIRLVHTIFARGKSDVLTGIITG
ncbi:hypothetical protein Ancab_033309 [Ancistrocladus abbreviatus]